MLVDSHAHLDSSRYDEDREATLRRAWQSGVGTVLSIGIGDGPDTMHRAHRSRPWVCQASPEVPRITSPPWGVHPARGSPCGIVGTCQALD